MDQIQFDVWAPVMMLSQLKSLNELVSEHLMEPEDGKLHRQWTFALGQLVDDEERTSVGLQSLALETATEMSNHLLNLHHQALLIMAVAAFENGLSAIAVQHLRLMESPFKLDDFRAQGVERATTVLRRLGKVEDAFKTKDWQKMSDAKQLRNKLAHGASWESSDGTDPRLGNLEENSKSTLIKLAEDDVPKIITAARKVLFDVIDEVAANHANS